MKRATIIAFPVLLGLVTWLTWPSVVAQNLEPKRRISVDEIGRSILLVGRLGVPIGEKMEISGHWHFPKVPQPKDASLRFSVTSVNGSKLRNRSNLITRNSMSLTQSAETSFLNSSDTTS